MWVEGARRENQVGEVGSDDIGRMTGNGSHAGWKEKAKGTWGWGGPPARRPWGSRCRGSLGPPEEEEAGRGEPL